MFADTGRVWLVDPSDVLLTGMPGISGRSPKLGWPAGEYRLCDKGKLGEMEGRATFRQNCVHQVTNSCAAVIVGFGLAGGRFYEIITTILSTLIYTVRWLVTCDLFWLILPYSSHIIYYDELPSTVK